MKDFTRLHLVGGRVCLDFANTVERAQRGEHSEWIESYTDLIDWSSHARIIDQADAGLLRRVERRDPRSAIQLLRRALLLRSVIGRIFTSVASGRNCSSADLGLLGREHAHLLRRRVISSHRRTYQWTWAGTGGPVDRLLWPLVDGATALLTSSDISRVKKCAGPSCAWLFLDESRNGGRRWCEMKVCGNRTKAHRHYLRQRR